jgi:putative iron-regulated protein|tara:strand:- start:456 stop:1691 length:1236 start_codon:yes stop_codon:yes gene_type:complete
MNMNFRILLRSLIVGTTLCHINCLPSPAQDGLFAPRKSKLILKAPVPKNVTEAKQLFVSNYSNIAEAASRSALSKGMALKVAISAFVKDPNKERHLLAKVSWMEARLPFLQSGFSHVIAESGKVNRDISNRLNGWPIDPGHIDYTSLIAGGNIISSKEKYPAITSEFLRSMNLKAGQSDFTTGYHVIEFLLWGEDLDKSSSGKRSFKDYDTNNSELAKRRADYLVACCDLLIQDLENLVSEWDPESKNNLRSRLESMPSDQAITKILGAVSFLAEGLAKSQIGSIISKGSVFKEQSTFSDTTHFDFLHTVAGISNLAAGAYVGLDGKLQVLGLGLIGLAEQIPNSPADKIRSLINNAMKSAQAFKGPFDVFNQEGENLSPSEEATVTLKALSESLHAFAKEINTLSKGLGS